ncbi:helix-turn-helix domain-containing protein [Bacillus thuringiensis]|uniref:helix-turn-helix domain-containing protein n=1 Tax=Bacillus thuringiensis TaxID=1428 RepID=UPI0005AEDFB5|nr:helix-turn-helix transcriptional regulator [Bacillus thuringiensis]KIP25006.1 helix-turn-helix family protein [Bacillus thuringiensis serovar morrisoni]MCT6946970.1 helix-turn-helix domain-containing protein [Bacillus thuringiensis]MED2076410.1 helix-turn-helix transcriptional regulator [Bacillus thuringiensis]MEE2016148.1 helix-turn-helix transcriptional regulator [Bacillus thuringiensis]NUW50773.1 helix-turn-helix transcriptional regulator [Bacillus thuringiensis]
MSNFLKLVGENIRILRKKRGLTQEELAERINLQQAYIGGIERGERNISMLTLQKIAVGLEIPPDKIFNFSNINSLENPQQEEFLSIITSLLHQKNVDELQFILKFLHNFSEFVKNNSIK